MSRDAIGIASTASADPSLSLQAPSSSPQAPSSSPQVTGSLPHEFEPAPPARRPPKLRPLIHEDWDHDEFMRAPAVDPGLLLLSAVLGAAAALALAALAGGAAWLL